MALFLVVVRAPMVFSPWFLAAMGANQQQPWQLGWSPSPSSSEPQQLLVACQVISWQRGGVAPGSAPHLFAPSCRRARMLSTPRSEHGRRVWRGGLLKGRRTRRSFSLFWPRDEVGLGGLKAVTRAGLTRLVQMSALIFGSAPSGGD